MGNKLSKDSLNLSNVMDRFQIIHTIPQQNISYLQQKQTKKQFMLRQITFNDKNQFNKAIQKINQKKVILDNHPHIVPITQYLTKSEDQFCSTFFKIYALYEYPNRNLDDQINQRRNQKRKFAQKQLWSILASCILALSHLQKHNIKHQSITSSHILLDSNGTMKIADPYCTSTDSNYYTLLIKRNTAHIYLAPQLCQCLADQQIHPQNPINPYKSDVFTLGMVILEAGLLQYQDDCYRDQCSRIHWQTIKYNLQRFSQLYTQQLKIMIQLMINKQEKQRPQWIWLQSYVKRGDDTKSNNNNFNSTNNSVAASRRTTYQQNPSISNIIEDIKPIKQSSFESSRPNIGIVPNNFYICNTRIDENLIEVQQQSLTRQNSHNDRNGNGIFKGDSKTSVTYSNQNNSNQIKYQNTKIYNNYVDTHNIQYSSNLVNPNSANYRYQPVSQTINHNIIVNPNLNSNISKLPVYSMNPIRVNPNQPILPNNYPINNNIINNNIGFPNYYNYQQNNQIIQNNINNPYFANLKNYQPTHNNFTLADTFNPSKQNLNAHIVKENKNVEVKYVIQTFKQGSRYQGQKVNGMRHGKGKFFYQDGGLYDGEWKQNKMCGRGKLYYQSGNIAYDGEWKNDQFAGFGVLYNQSPQQLPESFNFRNFDLVQEYWTKFQGYFIDDLKEGQGKLYFSNGEYFEGQFQKDYVNGKGIFYRKDNSGVRGQWRQNQIVNTF